MALLLLLVAVRSSAQVPAPSSAAADDRAPPAAASPPPVAVPPVAAPVRARERRGRPSVTWSVIAGLATAIVPMAIGGSLMPFDDAYRCFGADINCKHVGLYVMQAGFLLAPLVSHGVAGEWGRGALFAIPGVIAEAGMAAVLSAAPDVASQGQVESRVPFAILLGLSVAGAGAGIIDTFMAGDRWDRRHRLTLAPSLGPRQGGLTLGGTF